MLYAHTVTNVLKIYQVFRETIDTCKTNRRELSVLTRAMRRRFAICFRAEPCADSSHRSSAADTVAGSEGKCSLRIQHFQKRYAQV
jgi:hypothetical protein